MNTYEAASIISHVVRGVHRHEMTSEKAAAALKPIIASDRALAGMITSEIDSYVRQCQERIREDQLRIATVQAARENCLRRD